MTFTEKSSGRGLTYMFHMKRPFSRLTGIRISIHRWEPRTPISMKLTAFSTEPC